MKLFYTCTDCGFASKPFNPEFTKEKRKAYYEAILSYRPHIPILYAALALLVLFAGSVGAITIPSGVNYYLPLNVINTQSYTPTSNLQDQVSFNGLLVCNAIVCAPHLNNTEFFFGNGTLINSWYESANGLTNNYGSNTFSTSNGVYAWVLLPGNFIPASSSNYIYLGFEANSINVFNAMGPTGEAPQLNCPNQQSTSTCGGYAKYDNGNSIFSFYDNFKGTSLSSGWSNSAGNPGSPGTTSNIVNNGLSLSGVSPAWAGLLNSYSVPANYLIESYFESPGAYYSLSSSFAGTSPFGPSWEYRYPDLTPDWGLVSDNAGGIIFYNPTPQINTFYVFSGLFNSIYIGSLSEMYVNYASIGSYPLNPTASNTFMIMTYPLGATPTYTQWVRSRQWPPFGVMPSISQGTLTQTPSSYSVSITPTSSQAYDYGQSIVFNGIVVGGTGSYTYNFIVYNSVTNTQMANMLVINALASNTFTWGWPSMDAGNTVYANVMVTDSASHNGISTHSGVLTLYAAPTSRLYFTNAGGNSILTPQNAIANDLITGGSGTFSWAWTINNAGAANTAVSSTQTSNTYLSPGVGTYLYNVLVTDTGTATPFALAQEQNTLVVGSNSPLVFNSFSSFPSLPASLYPGQTITFTASVLNGQTSYTYNYIISTVPAAQPDVIAQYPNGLVVGYNSGNTGGLLLSVMGSAISGEKVYLKNETYNISTGTLTMRGASGMASNIGLYGAGKHKTVIQLDAPTSNGGAAVVAGFNSVTADLTLNVSDPTYAFLYPWGSTDSNYGNSTLRNVYINGSTDGIFLSGQPTLITPNALIIENVTDNTTWDSFNEFNWNSNTIPVFIADSTFSSNEILSPTYTGVTRALVNSRGIYTIVNSKFFAFNGTNATFGIYAQVGSITKIYGGKILTSNSPYLSNDIFGKPGTVVYVNSTVSYNALKSTGTVSLGSAPYGPYTYQKSPMPLPGIYGSTVVYSQQFTSILMTNSFTWTIPSGLTGDILQANVVVTDAEPATVNSVYLSTLTIIINPTAGTISCPLTSIIPSNGFTYTNNDIANTINLYITANSATSVFIGGNLVALLEPGNQGGSFIIPYNQTFRLTYSSNLIQETPAIPTFGSMYGYQMFTVVQVPANSLVGNTVTSSNIVAGQISANGAFTFFSGNSSLRVNIPGNYLITDGLTINSTQPSGYSNIGWIGGGIAVNGILQHNLVSDTSSYASALGPGSVSGTGIVYLHANDIVQFIVFDESLTGNTPIQLHHAMVTLSLLSNTTFVGQPMVAAQCIPASSSSSNGINPFDITVALSLCAFGLLILGYVGSRGAL